MSEVLSSKCQEDEPTTTTTSITEDDDDDDDLAWDEIDIDLVAVPAAAVEDEERVHGLPEDEDWLGQAAPVSKVGGAVDARDLLVNTTEQAVKSLNTPACRKKRRCILCTRPIPGSDMSNEGPKTCQRCNDG